jgi:hypothetical protein
MIELILTIEPPPVFAICPAASLVPRKHTGLVHRDDALPAFQAIRIADRAAGNPGIVYQDVDPAIARQGFRDQRHPFGLAGDVDRRGDAFPAGRANVGCNRLSCVAQDIGNDDLCAFRSE